MAFLDWFKKKEIKLCMDCKWYQLDDIYQSKKENKYIFAICTNPKINKLKFSKPNNLPYVFDDGIIEYNRTCQSARWLPPLTIYCDKKGIEGECGKKAKYFEPKIEESK